MLETFQKEQREFKGINWQVPKSLLPPEYLLVCYGILTPLGIESPKGSSLIKTFDKEIIALKGFIREGKPYLAILFKDESLGVLELVSNQLVYTYENFGTKLGIAEQMEITWFASEKVLIAWNGIDVVTYDIQTEQFISPIVLYWKGRLFIAKKKTIYWSVPNVNPFENANIWDVQNGAGYLELTTLSFSEIRCLFSKQDTIYVITDKGIAVITSTSASNDPTRWYVYAINEYLNIKDQNSYIRDPLTDHIFFITEKDGVYKLTTTGFEKIDTLLGNVDLNDPFMFSYRGFYYIGFRFKNECVYFNLTLASTRSPEYEWAQLKFEDPIKSIVSVGTDVYWSCENRLYKAFSSGEYLPIDIQTGDILLFEPIDKEKVIRKINIGMVNTYEINISPYVSMGMETNVQKMSDVYTKITYLPQKNTFLFPLGPYGFGDSIVFSIPPDYNESFVFAINEEENFVFSMTPLIGETLPAFYIQIFYPNIPCHYLNIKLKQRDTKFAIFIGYVIEGHYGKSL